MNGILKVDNKARHDLAQSANAEDDAFSVIKQRYPKIALKDMELWIGKARNFHRSMTLPWNDVGYRLLPNDKFFEFVNGMNEIKSNFVSARTFFKDNFELYKTEGLRKHGNYADTGIYPENVNELDNLFQLDIMIKPCPNVDDIRVDIPEDVLAKLREDSSRDITESAKSAVDDMWYRFREVLQHMTEVFSKNETKHIKSSVLNNVTKVIEMIPSYNLIDDEELNKRKEDAKEILKDIKYIYDVKENEVLRRETVDKINDLLNKFPEM